VTSMKRGKEGGGGREKEFLFEENKNCNNHVQYLPLKFQLFLIVHSSTLKKIPNCILPFWSPIMHK